ncbi:MAG: hypothetical protein ABSH07_12990 [Candidatus Dormibacteria bacterium]|jgi:predicted methyltransferase
MSRRDYRTIAAAIAATLADGADRRVTRELADTIASAMAHDNPRFSRARFLTAAGLE